MRAPTLSAILLSLLFSLPAPAQPQLERLSRGLVAVKQDNGDVFLSWRLLATDPEAITFNVYRSTNNGNPIKLNGEPLAGPTWFQDIAPPADQPSAYFVRAVVNGEPQQPGAPFTLPANSPARSYLSVPIQTPPGYNPGDASVADLDGDGDYEIILHMTGRGRDNASAGRTDPPILHAYKLDGTLLWSINLGRNIREGAHYTQFIVYDLDGDGRAELACKTADGTTDGTGKVIGDKDADHVGEDGKILKGPEFFTVFDGKTGAALATVDYIPPRGDIGAWGGIGGNGGNDRSGNRVDRFLAGLAFLDDKRPSVIMCRGYYGRSVIAAWDWRDGRLTSRWVFDSAAGGTGKDGKPHHDYGGMGAHSLSVADVDHDGKDEIIYHSMIVDDDGVGLHTSGLRHGDALHVGRFDPASKNQQIFTIHENEGSPWDKNTPAAALRDAGTGKVLFRINDGGDAGRGIISDIDPRHPGAEMWGFPPAGLYTVKGENIGRAPRSANFVIWWDGDLLREILTGNRITKWDWENQQEKPLFTADGAQAAAASKQTPCVSADLFGDWREEMILRSADNRELRIYTTTIPTEYRLTTLMHDPQYRCAIAWQNVAYNQPPHPSFLIEERAKKAAAK